MAEHDELLAWWDETTQDFLDDIKNPETRRARSSDLRWLQSSQVTSSEVEVFIRGTSGEIRQLIERRQEQMVRCGSATATINRSMRTTHLLLRCLNQRGVRPQVEDRITRFDPTQFEVTPSDRAEQGQTPSRQEPAQGDAPLSDSAVQALLDVPDQSTLQGQRNWLILHLMACYAMSRMKILTLNVGDFDSEKSLLRSLRLRRNDTLELRLERLRVTDETRDEVGAAKEGAFELLDLMPETCQALCKYLEAGGHQDQADAPLFYSLDHKRIHHAPTVQRLTKNGLYTIVAACAKKCGHPEINSRRLQKTGLTRLAAQKIFP